jgi:2-phosphosulfolactate phosphatase
MQVSLSFERAHSKDVVIMVDVLRASTTITVALETFQRIIPTKTIEEANRLARKYQATLAGERGGATIEGFHVGNSPLQIKNFSGETLVLTTSNGTRVLESFQAKTLVGSFVNAKKVAQKAMDIADEHIEVIMAGVNGEFAIEDFLGAGEIISNLKDHEMDDMALAAYLASLDHEQVDETVRNCRSAVSLGELGFGSDVDFCLQRNTSTKVPIYKKGIIEALSE